MPSTPHLNTKPHALVTGATGFIGSHLVESLLQKNYEVFCIVRKTSDLSLLKKLPCTFIDGDITDRNSLIDAVRDKDIIFHLGGLTKAKSVTDYYRVNADASQHLYEICLQHNPGIRKIVHVSSLAAAGPSTPGKPRVESDSENPLTDYGKSKLAGEKIAVSFMNKLPITIIRPPAVYGPREKDIFFYFQLIDKHIKPILGFQTKYLTIIHALDLVEAIVRAAESPQSTGHTYFVDDGYVYSWQDLSSTIQKASGTWAIPLTIPEWLISGIAHIAEFFSRFSSNPALLNRQKIIELKQVAWTTNSEKIKRDLGFSPKYDLLKGCKMTVDWYRENGWL